MNLAVGMLLGGLWHGASWTFILWGGYHGMLLILHRIFVGFKKPSENHNDARGFIHIIQTLAFFHVIGFGWLLFRAESVLQAIHMLKTLLIPLQSRPLKQQYQDGSSLYKPADV